MLRALCKPFVEASPLSVMMRGLAERLLNPEQLDQWFEQFAQEQYTRELLFSTVVSLMLEGGCGTRKSVNAAYPALEAAIPVSIQAGYEKLRGVEPGVAAELVRYAARDGQAVIAALAGASPAVLPGYPVRILEGNPLAATEHRLTALRAYGGGRYRVRRWWSTTRSGIWRSMSSPARTAIPRSGPFSPPWKPTWQWARFG